MELTELELFSSTCDFLYCWTEKFVPNYKQVSKLLSTHKTHYVRARNLKLIGHIFLNFPIAYNEEDIWDILPLRWCHTAEINVQVKNCARNKNKFASSLENNSHFHLNTWNVYATTSMATEFEDSMSLWKTRLWARHFFIAEFNYFTITWKRSSYNYYKRLIISKRLHYTFQEI